MKTYSSTSSVSVKMITVSAILIITLVIIEFVFIRKDFGPLSGTVLGIMLTGAIFYYYANSLKSIVVTDKSLILQKNIGKIEIEFSEIESVKNMEYCNLPMSVGSKGFFGFIGGAMDGSESFVKDRSKMVQIITTSNKKYLISCENSKELVNILSIENNS